MSTGKFVISLDCEGKWGVADRVDAVVDVALTTGNLRQAYRRILELFARHEVPATFAFVITFTFSQQDLKRYSDLLEDVSIAGGNWLRHFRRQMEEGVTEGWFMPELIDEVRTFPMHEIGSHGFSHLPVGDPNVDREAAAREFRSAMACAKDKGINLETYVYPRNLVAHRDRLMESGIRGYRGSRFAPGWLGAFAGAASEFNLFQPAQEQTAPGNGIREIPPGFFLNWRSGLRGKVPYSVTIRRWRHIIDDAARRNRVAHLWLHPHNIIGSPDTFRSLADITAYAADLRDNGKLEIVTQAEYCHG